MYKKIGKKYFFLLFFLLLIGSIFVNAEVPIIKLGVPNVSKFNSNSSDFWDNLDTPSDISMDDLNDFVLRWIEEANNNRTGGDITYGDGITMTLGTTNADSIIRYGTTRAQIGLDASQNALVIQGGSGKNIRFITGTTTFGDTGGLAMLIDSSKNVNITAGNLTVAENANILFDLMVGSSNAPTHTIHIDSASAQDGIIIDAVQFPEVEYKVNGASQAFVAVTGPAGGFITGSLANSLIVRGNPIHFGVDTVMGMTLSGTGLHINNNLGVGSVVNSNVGLHLFNQLTGQDDLGDWDNYQQVITGHGLVPNGAGILLSSSIDGYGGSAIMHWDKGGGGLGDLVFYTKQSTAQIPPVAIMNLTNDAKVLITGTLNVNSAGVNNVATFTSTDATASIILADSSDSAFFGTEGTKAYFGMLAGLDPINVIVDTAGLVTMKKLNVTQNASVNTLELPQTTASGDGIITLAGLRYIHSAGDNTNFYGGANAGKMDTTSQASVGIGQLSLRFADGTSNSALGYRTGLDLTSGAYNNMFGRSACENLVSGNFNTCIGRNAGLTLTTQDYGIYLGDQSGRYETGSNKLFIDSLDRTNEAGGRTKSLIYGIFNVDPTLQSLVFNSEVNVSENLNVVGNITGEQIRGGVAFHNDTEGNVTPLTEDIWKSIQVFNQGSNDNTLNGFSVDISGNLTVLISGEYHICWGTTFTGSANNKYHGALGINDVIDFNFEEHDRITTGADVMDVDSCWFADLIPNDKLTVMIMNEDSGGDSTHLSARISAVRVGS